MTLKFLLFCFLMGAFLINPLALPVLYAEGHGCSMNEPDRDEDGVPDKDDAYPDDPMLADS